MKLHDRRFLYAAIGVVAILATLFGVSNGSIFGVTPTPTPQLPQATVTPPENPVDAQPAPGLFDNVDLAATDLRFGLSAQATGARLDIQDFFDDQPKGGGIDDAAFVAWASRQIVQAEPSAAARRGEQAAILATLDPSTKKDRAAHWLTVHGCRDVWTSYVLEQERFHADSSQVARKSELNDVLELAARVAAAGQRRLAADPATIQAPCAPTAARSDAATCDCAFPSAGAAMSAAARTYLSAFEPRAERLYAWMERQVDTAAVYDRIDLPSDVKAGSRLGYLTGRYYLTSRGYAGLLPTPPRATAGP